MPQSCEQTAISLNVAHPLDLRSHITGPSGAACGCWRVRPSDWVGVWGQPPQRLSDRAAQTVTKSACCDNSKQDENNQNDGLRYCKGRFGLCWSYFH
jgi:hypothetical protein